MQADASEKSGGPFTPRQAVDMAGSLRLPAFSRDTLRHPAFSQKSSPELPKLFT